MFFTKIIRTLTMAALIAVPLKDGNAYSAVEAISNGSFETPAITTYVYRPTGTGWTFLGNAGIEHNGSAWGAAAAPDGTQAAFLQGGGYALGGVQQVVSLDAGTYFISFKAARRNTQIQPIKVSLDGTQLGSTITPSSSTFAGFDSAQFTVAAGNHTIRLEATDNTSDRTSFVDMITITRVNVNYALNRVTNFSSQQVGNEATHVANGDEADRWSAKTFPQYVEFDLGTERTVNNIVLKPYLNRAYQYKVESKLKEADSYRVILDKTGNMSGGSEFSDDISAAKMRYVKLTVVGVEPDSTTTWCSIHEFGLYNNGGVELNTPPSVSITSPSSGAIFNTPASILITANASDSDGTISSVKFYNGSSLLYTDSSSPYAYTWNNVAKGTYSIKAVAVDNDGASTTSSAVAIEVNESPSVSITSPSSGSIFNTPASVLIKANASDSDGTISSVKFYNGSSLLYTDSSSPYAYTWNNVAKGTYSIKAVAVDNDGASKTSSAVAIEINNSPSVSITSPSSGSIFNTPANVLIKANASDSDGTISSVKFYNGSSLLYTDWSSPYAYTWNNVAKGTYSITAVAMDDDGASRGSSAVTFEVSWVDTFVHRTTKPSSVNCGVGVYQSRAVPTANAATKTGVSYNSTKKEYTVAAGVTVENAVFYGFVNLGDKAALLNCLIVGPPAEYANNRPLVQGPSSSGRGQIDFCTVDPTVASAYYEGIGRGILARRCVIRNITDGVKAYSTSTSGARIRVEDSLLERMSQFSPDYVSWRAETHNDLIQFHGNPYGTKDDIVLDGCALNARHSLTHGDLPPYREQISAVMFTPQASVGASHGKIIYCWLEGGVFCVNAGSDAALMATSSLEVSYCRFERPGTNVYGDGRAPDVALAVDKTLPFVGVGNTYIDNGAAVPISYR